MRESINKIEDSKPLLNYSPDHKYLSHTKPSSFPGHGIKICILDSDRMRIADMSAMFNLMGYEVLSLDYVIGASNTIRDFDPDVLVLDVNMPAITGEKLINVLKKNLGVLPTTILYSDMDAEELEKLAMIAGADDHLVKNGTYLHLLNRVKYYATIKRFS